MIIKLEYSDSKTMFHARLARCKLTESMPLSASNRDVAIKYPRVAIKIQSRYQNPDYK